MLESDCEAADDRGQIEPLGETQLRTFDDHGHAFLELVENDSCTQAHMSGNLAGFPSWRVPAGIGFCFHLSPSPGH